MNETSVDKKLHQTSTAPLAAGMTMADGSHLTGVRGMKPALASFNDRNAFSAEEDKSSRKRRLKKEMLLKQQETEAVSEDEMGALSLKDNGRAVMSSLRGTCLSHGSVSVIGRRRVMEDAVAIELGFLTIDDSRHYDFFGVYDGHGGSRVANSCQGRLHHLLVEEFCNTPSYFGKDVWSKIMINCFLKMNEEVNGSNAPISSKNESHSSTIGSTALVAVVGEDEVVVANCGDSRAVFSRGGIPLHISNDHKPDRPDELERIESAGGRVIDWDGHRVFGVLATSRSIGDQYLQPFVIPEPEVTLTKRSSGDEFLILATDGLWDVVTNEMACLAVKRCLEGRSLKKRRSVGEIQEEEDDRRRGGGKKEKQKKTNRRAEMAACLLVDLAISRGSKDNISVVVVDLNKARKQEEEDVEDEAKAKGKKVIQ